MEEIEILLPYLRQVSDDPEEIAHGYTLTGAAMNELHSRSHQKLQAERLSLAQVKRINREVEALWESPYAYALLVVDDAVHYLRKKGVSVTLAGPWTRSYYAYLMGLLPAAPRQGKLSCFMTAPLELQVFGDDAQLCREALLLAAWKHKFYVRARDDRELLLLPPEENENPAAPVIRILPKT